MNLKAELNLYGHAFNTLLQYDVGDWRETIKSQRVIPDCAVFTEIVAWKELL